MRKINHTGYFLEGIFISLLLAWIFYHNLIVTILLLPLSLGFMVKRKKEAEKKSRRQFNVRFKDAIISMSAALSSGYSLENSVAESCKEMELLYGKDSDIYRELKSINSKIGMNIPVENLFMELAERKRIDDVEMFAQVIFTAKRTGGNMVDIIRNTSDVISGKIETMEEIEVIISAKKMQQKIMNIVPVFMVGYISITSADFFGVMYETLIGRIIMTICLVAYITAYWISERIVDIEI